MQTWEKSVTGNEKSIKPFNYKDPTKCSESLIIKEIICASDKSLTHRSIIFSSIAKGVSRITYPLLGADCLSTIDCFRALGVSIEVQKLECSSGYEVIVDSPGIKGFKNPVFPLDCGNSGTTARLLMGLFASIPGLKVELRGDASLSSRPMGRVSLPLEKMGAKIEGANGNRNLPAIIEGVSLTPMEHHVTKATAQVKSALILAGLNSQGTTSVTLPRGSRDHTEKMLKKIGAPLTSGLLDNGRFEKITIQGPFEIKASDYKVPVDPSSAAFFCVLGLIHPCVRICLKRVLGNGTRTGFLKVLQRMGGSLTVTDYECEEGFVEKVVDIEVDGKNKLQAVEILPDEVPTLVDEIPILAVAASFADGVSSFRGLAELRVKESDRLENTAKLLSLAGVVAKIEGDDLIIKGGGSEVESFSFDPCDDHRLAMAASILAKRAKGSCTIKNPQCVDVSFPGFFDHLDFVD